MSTFKAYCFVSISPVRSGASDQSEIVTQLLFGEIVTVNNIDVPWANITTENDNYSGYIDHKHIRKLSDKEVKRWMDGQTHLTDREIEISTPWGKQRICRGSYIQNDSKFNIGNDSFSFLQESKNNCINVIDYAKDYLNTPYLWGGKSPFGIDCSGITQIIYRLFDINLPRDASDQVLHGIEIDYEDIEEGDLAYFDKNGKVTHVGILDGIGGIYHAAGYVRYDQITREGIINSDSGDLTHKLFTIKRI